MVRLRVVLAALLAFAVPTISSASTYYVSNGTFGPAGSDGTSCPSSTNIGSPRLTFAGGIACLSAGDTLAIRGGYYDASLTNAFVGHSGTSWSAAGKVTISAYQTESVWLRPTTFSNYWVMYFHTSNQQYIEFVGINMDSRGVEGGMRIEADGTGNPHHIRYTHAEVIGGSNGKINETLFGPQHFAITQSLDGLQGGNEFTYLTVHGGGDTGDMYYAWYINSDNTLVDHCEIYDVAGYSIQIYSAYAGHPNPQNVTISNSSIHDVSRSMDSRTAGIIFASGDGHVAFNNVIYNISLATSFGIRTYGPNSKIYNNTVFNVQQYGIEVLNSASNTIVQNNIAYGSGTNYVNASGSTTHDHNLDATPGTNPGFTSSGTGDFSILTGSAAKDAGTTVALVGFDIRGTARPFNSTYDIGAFEFTTVVPDPDVDTPAAGTTFVSDTFTDTSGLNLVTGPHIGGTGATWALQSGSTAGMVISSANRLRGGTIDVDTFSYASGIPISAEYDANVAVHTFTTVSGHTFLVWVRMQPGARTGYFAIYNLNPGTLELWVTNNYAYTFLGTCSPNFADGSDHTVRLEARDSKKKLYYDSNLCASSSDNSVAAAGRAGLGIYTPTTAATNSTSFHLSDVTVIDVQTDMTPPPDVLPSVVSRFRFVTIH